jgi:hypothetical protein
VLLDYGTDAPPPANTGTPPFKAAANTGWKVNAQAALDDAGVLASLDREISVSSERSGVRATYQKYLLREARLHRSGLMPLVEENSILEFLDRQQWTSVSFEPIASGVARSADLGYSYGKYSLQRKDAPGVLERGYYARVWKRDGKGNWKIAMDVANALPPDAPAKP